MMKMNAKNSSNMHPPQRQYVRQVVLDWNIIQYWINEKMRPNILPVLEEMNDADLQFTMSEVSVHEGQCRLPIGKHIEARNFMNGIPRFPVDYDTQLISGSVFSCYRNHEKTKAHAKAISLPDVYNAACTILNNALLITSDVDDYPWPFFDVVYTWTILNEKGSLLKICLLQPDNNQFEEMVKKWVKMTASNKANKEKQSAIKK